MKLQQKWGTATSTMHASHKTSILAHRKGFTFGDLTNATFWNKDGVISMVPNNILKEEEAKSFILKETNVNRIEDVIFAPPLEQLQQFIEEGFDMVVESNFVKMRKPNVDGTPNPVYRGRVVALPTNKGDFEFIAGTRSYPYRFKALEKACRIALEQLADVQGINQTTNTRSNVRSTTNTQRREGQFELTTDMKLIVDNEELSKTERITRLNQLGLTERQISNALNVPYSFVHNTVQKTRSNKTVEQD